MTHGEGLNPPEPPKDWTDTHELNETLRGEVIERDNFESKSDGSPFSVIFILTKDGDRHRVPCSRTDLRPIIEQDDAGVGDELAITYWGKAGSKFVYTHEIRKASWSGAGATDVINALKGSCFYCGGFVGTDGHPFVFAPMPPRGDGLGWTLEPVCLLSG